MFKKTFFVFALSLIAALPLCAETQLLESTLSVDSTINQEVMPDSAKIKFYVINTGKNINEIKDLNDKISSEIVRKVKEKLKADESIRSVSYGLNSLYNYKDKVKTFSSYELRNGYEIKLKDLTKISEVIKIATDNGAKEINSVVFMVENTEDVCNQMLAQVSKSAKKRADYIADSLGVTLNKVKSVAPYCSLNSSTTQPRYFAKALNSSADSAVGEQKAIDIIEPNVINARAGVSLIYYIK